MNDHYTLSIATQFDSPELNALDLPVEVREPDSELVDSGLSSDKFSLKEGTYFVTARLPAGQQLSTRVEVNSTSDNVAIIKPRRTVVLDASRPDIPLPGGTSQNGSGSSFLAELSGKIRDAIKPQSSSSVSSSPPSDSSVEDPPTDSGGRQAFGGTSGSSFNPFSRSSDTFDTLPAASEAASSDRDLDEIYRTLSSRSFASETTQSISKRIAVIESLGAISNSIKVRVFRRAGRNTYSPLLSDGWGEFTASANGTQISINGGYPLLLLQCLQTGKPALNMILPVGGASENGPSIGCSVLLRRLPATAKDSDLELEVHLQNPAADAMLQYRLRGGLSQAAVISKSEALSAETLLYSKEQDPIAAAIGAYMLLRFGDMDGLRDDRTANLMSWFDWLPDGCAIRGEHLARLGKHEEALEAFLGLQQRGLPCVSAGLGYAIDRLRTYTDPGLKESNFPRDAVADAANLMQYLCSVANFVDFQKTFVTFTGIDPNIPEAEPIRDVNDFDGLDIGDVAA